MHFILGVVVYFFPNKKLKKIIKKRKKNEANCVLHYFLGFGNKVGQSIFTEHAFCILFSFDELTYYTLLVETL